VLKSIGQPELEELGRDDAFCAAVRSLIDDRSRRNSDPFWFPQSPAAKTLHLTVYFSMEFGLSEALPIYAGELGVLAGDHMKSSTDLGAPVVGVGLLYQQGYFRQTLDSQGNQRELYPFSDPREIPVQRMRGKDGAWIRIPLYFPGRTVYLRAWRSIAHLPAMQRLGWRSFGIASRIASSWPRSAAMTVLMTGFPGFLASSLLPRILRRTDSAAMCLVQPKFAVLAERHVAELSAVDPSLRGRIRLVQGDITQPGLGLSTDALNGVTEAWHLAAAYDLTVAREVGVRVNVDGTRNVLDALERCPTLTRLHYFSTCYVPADANSSRSSRLLRPAHSLLDRPLPCRPRRQRDRAASIPPLCRPARGLYAQPSRSRLGGDVLKVSPAHPMAGDLRRAAEDRGLVEKARRLTHRRADAAG
jgi:hypothetical protein